MKPRDEKGQFIRQISNIMYDGYAVYFDKKGYANVWLNGRDSKVHVLEWEKHNGTKPKGYEIHHKDENKAYWHISNLELLTPGDHHKVHAGWVRENGIWVKKPCKDCKRLLPLVDFYPRKGLSPSNRCIKCAKEFWIKGAREKGVPKKNYIKPNIKGEYECRKCNKWKGKEFFKLKQNGTLTGCCKDCFNIYQNQRRNNASRTKCL